MNYTKSLYKIALLGEQFEKLTGGRTQKYFEAVANAQNQGF